ncbi:MAG: hypothetical protein RLZZ210_1204 [Pseudomonadota bacterium]|jgi:hypothetical protein
MVISVNLVRLASQISQTNETKEHEKLLLPLQIHELANLSKISPDTQSQLIKAYASQYVLSPNVELSIFSDTGKYSERNLSTNKNLIDEAQSLVTRESDKNHISTLTQASSKHSAFEEGSKYVHLTSAM